MISLKTTIFVLTFFIFFFSLFFFFNDTATTEIYTLSLHDALPIFTLEGQEGRLFKPLAFTKNYSMAIAAVLAITLDPAMRLLFTHMDPYVFRPRWLARIVNAVLVGKIHSEE